MKKLILSASFAFALLTTTNTFAQQGFGTNQPDKSAAVDIVSSKRGLLIPRISIADLDQAAPVNNPATSLFVYNTNTTTGVGFYYWDGSKWVRFVSTNNERDVVVQAAANGNIDIPTATYDANGVKTYNVSVKGGEEGQVLVSNATGGTEWTDPNTFVLDVLTAGNAIGIVADPLDPTKVEVKFNGTLSENTTITTGSHDLAITGLEEVDVADLSATDNIVIMGNDGVLKITSRTSLFDAKNLTLGDGLTFEADIDDNDGVGAVLKATKIEIKDNSVTAVKLDAKGETERHVATVNNDGTVTYQAITPASLIDKKTLTGDGITVTAGTTVGTDSSVADALLADVTLGIADGAITNTKLAPGAVSQDKMTSYTTDNGTATPVPLGQVPVADGSGNVTYQNVATAIGQELTSNSITVTPTSGTTNTALLEALNIEITPGTAEGQILTTTNTGTITDPVLSTNWATPNSLVAVDNGLNKNDTTDKIHLGGDLIEPTEIKTDDTNTLAISGLVPAREGETNKVVVSEGATGILRTVERVVEGTNANVVSNAGYSFYTPEVVLNITLPQTGSDVTVNFPNAESAVGQVINIKIANTDETHSTYLNVLNTYGAMPYQGWIVKSNGSAWIIVGRN